MTQSFSNFPNAVFFYTGKRIWVELTDEKPCFSFFNLGGNGFNKIDPEINLKARYKGISRSYMSTMATQGRQ